MTRSTAASTTPKRRSSALAKQRKTYVEARLDGKNKSDAARQAGYAQEKYATVVERAPDVAKALQAAREQLSDITQLKRADVVQMLTEAYDLAKLAGEPSSMVAAAREIGKMLGLYAPETKELILTAGQANLQSKMQALGDDELLAIAEGNATVVEGEFVRIN